MIAPNGSFLDDHLETLADWIQKTACSKRDFETELG